MPVLVKPTHNKLKWPDFKESTGALQDHDAEAGYGSEMRPAKFSPRKIKRRAYLPATYTIRVWPTLKVAPGANQTAELLGHEQLHYDVGIACARVLARELAVVSGADPADLIDQVTTLHELHMYTNADAIQKAYDVQTDHGRKAKEQGEWQDAMKQCLASSTMNRLMGLPL